MTYINLISIINLPNAKLIDKKKINQIKSVKYIRLIIITKYMIIDNRWIIVILKRKKILLRQAYIIL